MIDEIQLCYDPDQAANEKNSKAEALHSYNYYKFYREKIQNELKSGSGRSAKLRELVRDHLLASNRAIERHTEYNPAAFLEKLGYTQALLDEIKAETERQKLQHEFSNVTASLTINTLQEGLQTLEEQLQDFLNPAKKNYLPKYRR
jgi:hypothetical protein